jgi:hypothetical protein
VTLRSEAVQLFVVPQHPATTPPLLVHVPGPLLPGPVGSRLAVFDYNRDRDLVFPPAQMVNGVFQQETDTRNVHFQQLNAYAVAARAIGFVEREMGRSLSWGFDGGRLILLPHAGQMANAFYSESTKSLQFYSYLIDDEAYHTCLVHDIVAHEVGHALLDSVRGRYMNGLHPDTGAIHEAVGDLTALLAALSYSGIRESILAEDGRSLRPNNEVATIAERFHGDETRERSALRDLARSTGGRYGDATEPHERSLALTTALYQALRKLFDKNIGSGMGGEKAIRIAHVALQRMVVRGLDYLPPMDATFEEFGRALLQADRFANPTDKDGYRRAVAVALAMGGIGASADALLDNEADPEPWPQRPAVWPPYTATDAYLFLDRHRDRLALGSKGKYRDFVVRHFHVTRYPEGRKPQPKDMEPGQDKGSKQDERTPENEIDNVVMVYEYPVDIELSGRRFGTLRGSWITVWGGGTLVFDGNGGLRHHARKPVKGSRVKQAIGFVGSMLAERRASIHSGDRTSSAEVMDRHPYLATVTSGEFALTSNLAAGCGRRMPAVETPT